MVNDPYKVLGIQEGATQDEIKSAYRRMAKKYHPDLHPDDEQAALKMNEVNEAYDMLTHPEKYAKRRAEEQARQNYSGYNDYYRQNNNANRNGYQGAGGWYSDFNGFDFEDFFNFGGFNYYSQNTNVNLNPKAEPGDSAEIIKAINLINQGRYQEAFRTLMNIEHSGRNARWYYLNAITLYGYGDTSQAVDYIQKAVQLDPNNSNYHTLLQKFRTESKTYYTHNTVVFNPFRKIGRIILFIFIIRIFFNFLQLLMMGGSGFYPPM